jgi:hypothetical protein
MKQYDEIKRILTEELGFATLADYERWVRTARAHTSPTPERIEKLSPDSVDCRAFWRVCDELFGLDPVFNVVVAPKVGSLPRAVDTRMDANRMNLRLAQTLGITAFLSENAAAALKTLEIGPGFGSLKHYIETHTQHLYMGVDARPRIEGVMETTAEGLLPRRFVADEGGQYSYVVSSNVFQHLSARQRSRYFEDAEALLRKGGLFIFNLLVDSGKLPPSTRDAEGRAWSDHYGQYTLVPTAGELYGELSARFDILYVTQRYDSLFNFVCAKR